MRNYLVDYQLSKIVHTSYIYLFYYRCIYRCAWKVKGSCATPHLKTHKLKIKEFSNASLYKIHIILRRLLFGKKSNDMLIGTGNQTGV